MVSDGRGNIYVAFKDGSGIRMYGADGSCAGNIIEMKGKSYLAWCDSGSSLIVANRYWKGGNWTISSIKMDKSAAC